MIKFSKRLAYDMRIEIDQGTRIPIDLEEIENSSAIHLFVLRQVIREY